jgi:uncharacterized membrane protein YqiK
MSQQTTMMNPDLPPILAVVGIVLVTHPASILRNFSREEIERDPGVCAARMQPAAAADLANMGLALVSFAIRAVRPA